MLYVRLIYTIGWGRRNQTRLNTIGRGKPLFNPQTQSCSIYQAGAYHKRHEHLMPRQDEELLLYPAH